MTDPIAKSRNFHSGSQDNKLASLGYQHEDLL